MPNTNWSLNQRQLLGADDEFPTLVSDIDAMAKCYRWKENEIFKGKKVFLPCDVYSWSGFSLWFNTHFDEFELEQLTCRGYNQNGCGKVFQRTKHNRVVRDAIGHGDFREPEAEQMKEEADMIVTNPPFSLKRPFLKFIEDTKYYIVFPYLNMYLLPKLWKKGGSVILDSARWHFRKDVRCVSGTNIDILKQYARPIPKGLPIEVSRRKYSSVPFFGEVVDGALHVPRIDCIPSEEEWDGAILTTSTISAYDLSDWNWKVIDSPTIHGRDIFRRILMSRK